MMRERMGYQCTHLPPGDLVVEERQLQVQRVQRIVDRYYERVVVVVDVQGLIRS